MKYCIRCMVLVAIGIVGNIKGQQTYSSSADPRSSYAVSLNTAAVTATTSQNINEEKTPEVESLVPEPRISQEPVTVEQQQPVASEQQPTYKRLTFTTADENVKNNQIVHLPWNSHYGSEVLDTYFEASERSRIKIPLPIDVQKAIPVFRRLAPKLSLDPQPTVYQLSFFLDTQNPTDCIEAFKFSYFFGSTTLQPILANYLPKAYARLTIEDKGETLRTLLAESADTLRANLVIGKDAEPLLKPWLADGRKTQFALQKRLDTINEKKITHIRFSHDGKFLVFRLNDASWALSKVADPAHPIVVLDYINEKKINRIEFSLDGKLVALELNDYSWALSKIDDPTHPVVETAIGGKQILNIKFSPDDKLVAFRLDDQSWALSKTDDPTNPVLDTAVKGKRITSIEFSPDSKRVAFRLADQSWALSKVDDPAHPVLDNVSEKKISNIRFSRDGKLVALFLESGSWALSKIDDLADPVVETAIGGKQILNITFSPDGKVIALQSSDASWDLRKIDDPAHPIVVDIVKGKKITHISFSPDSKLVVLELDDNSLALSKVNDPAHPIKTIDEKKITRITFSPDGKFVALELNQSFLVLSKIDDPAHPVLDTVNKKKIAHIEFSPDGKLLAFMLDNGSWALSRIDDPAHPIVKKIRGISFSSGSKFVELKSSGGYWDIRKIDDPTHPVVETAIGGKQILTMEFSPDDKFIALRLDDDTFSFLDGQLFTVSFRDVLIATTIEELLKIPGGKEILANLQSEIEEQWLSKTIVGDKGEEQLVLPEEFVVFVTELLHPTIPADQAGAAAAASSAASSAAASSVASTGSLWN